MPSRTKKVLLNQLSIGQRGALLHWWQAQRKETKMIDTKLLDELRKKMEELFARTPAKDIEKNMRAVLTNFLSRLDLVTREEFDVQTEVLRRTREHLVELEAKVAALERADQQPEAR
jgi:BMFP domain-containing protein YqiC